MFVKFVFLITLVFVTADYTDRSNEEYIDAVVDLLLNGNNDEIIQSSEDENGQEPVLIEGIWKCGDCDDTGDSKLMYSEVNAVDADISDGLPMDVQVGLSLQGMRCITLSSDAAGVVRRVSGACNGSDVTLTVALTHHFTVRVYGD